MESMSDYSHFTDEETSPERLRAFPRSYKRYMDEENLMPTASTSGRQSPPGILPRPPSGDVQLLVEDHT